MNSEAQVLTFVFTDIEGSTRLLRRLHDEYARLLAEHHALLDREFRAGGGRRLATEGDGGFFVFDSPARAVRAAVSAQQALEGHPWPAGARVRVRMGMHTGEAVQSGPNTYVGLAVHLAARISALGRGGQVLVSADTRRASATHDVDFYDLGEHRLADFPEPVRIFQAGDALDGAAPSLRSIADTPLPAAINTLFGRTVELDDLIAEARAHRLVTVLGPGGTGKTRLVVEAARRMRGEGRSVDFVDLTGVALAERIPAHVASALGLPQDPDVSPVAQIASLVGRRDGVLVLDNCEHLMPEVAEFTVSLLAHSERLAIIATSRVLLGVPGEHIFELDPLQVGTAGDAGPAVEMFIDRARDVSPDFEVDAEARAAVHRIVTRLDGLPLAIELAASMMRLLPVGELEHILAERLDVLEAGEGRPDRHRSLAAALRWNVDALPSEARKVFDRLGVMTGPFLLDDLGVLAEVGPVEALRLAGTLIDHSLLARSRVAGKASFRMLETIRWFALENLQQAGTVDEVRRLHLNHFVGVARASRETMRSPAAFRFLPQLWPRRPNLLAALDHALASGDLTAAVELVEGLVEPWSVRSAGREARLATSRVMAAATGSNPELELRAGLARLEMWQADGVGNAPEARLAKRVYTLARDVGTPGDRIRSRLWMIAAGRLPLVDPDRLVDELEAADDWRSTAYGLEALGWMLWWQDRYPEGNQVFRRMRRQAVERGDPVALLDATGGFAATSHGMETLAEARRWAEEAGDVAERLGCTWWESLHIQWEASHSRRLGHLDESAEWLERAYRLARDRGTINQLAFVTSNQAALSWLRGDVDGAYRKIREFSDANRQAADTPYNPFVLEMAAAVALAWDVPRIGAMLCGVAEEWRRPGGLTEHGMPLPGWDTERHEAVVAGLVDALGEKAFNRAAAEGRTLGREEALELALSLAPPG